MTPVLLTYIYIYLIYVIAVIHMCTSCLAWHSKVMMDSSSSGSIEFDPFQIPMTSYDDNFRETLS